MSGILIENIGQLLQVRQEPQDKEQHFCAGTDMDRLPYLNDAWLYIRDGLIDGFGTMNSCPYREDVPAGTKIVDASGRCVFPSFCDCHTHLVFA
ncbi:MAG TPA: imidazolonepropionase, partial [Bacteroidales bacterium]|nr:imidazolonepropionase [Bacteroidales bacterium]